MARLDWMTFLAAHPQAHLLAVHMVAERSPTELKHLRRLMQTLIDREDPAGDYATAIVRRRDVTEIQCGFVEHADAERVGAQLGARSVLVSEGASDGWLSECRLRLNARAELALEGKAATPRRTSHHAPAEREPQRPSD
jgi:hypothetical protein